MTEPLAIDVTASNIARSAREAVQVIAAAAQEAAKVVANAAAESVKVVNLKSEGDHDLLIRIETRMEGLKEDISEIKSGTSVKIADHEIRLIGLEKAKGNTALLISIGIGLLTLLVSLLVFHLFKI